MMTGQAHFSGSLETTSRLILGLIVTPQGTGSAHFTALSATLTAADPQISIIAVPVLPGSAPPVRPERPDVVLVDVTTGNGLGLLDLIQDGPQLADIPVMVMLETPHQMSIEQYLRCGVTDFVSTASSTEEVIHRLRISAARTAHLAAADETMSALRSRVRSVSTALAETTSTISTGSTADTAADAHSRSHRELTQVFVSGLTRAFAADRVCLDLFDDNGTGVSTERWPATWEGLPSPGAAGPDAEDLAHHLWNAAQIGIFNAPHRSSTHRFTGATHTADHDSKQSMDESPEDQDDVPSCTIAVPLADTDHVVGLVQLISDTGPMPWSDVHSALLHHVGENFVRALRQVRLHARNAEAIERLAYLNFLKDDFVATINHEFRSPLATITGHLEMLADGFLGPIPEHHRETLDILQRNTARLNQLVENILTVSVLDQPRSTPTPVDVTELLHTVITGMKALTTDKNIQLTTNVPVQPVLVMGHRGQLEEALRNVLRNSLDFTAPTGTITISISAVSDHGLKPHQAANRVSNRGPDLAPHQASTDKTAHALITVQDTGIGIPDEDLPHLFTSFYRGSNIKRSSATGSGLGLTITKQILDRHEGTITITSETRPKDEATFGTTVLIALPLTTPLPLP